MTFTEQLAAVTDEIFVMMNNLVTLLGQPPLVWFVGLLLFGGVVSIVIDLLHVGRRVK